MTSYVRWYQSVVPNSPITSFGEGSSHISGKLLDVQALQESMAGREKQVELLTNEI